MLAQKIEKETVGLVSPRPGPSLPQAGPRSRSGCPGSGWGCLRLTHPHSDPSKSSTVPWTTSSGSWLGCRRRLRLSSS